MVSGLGFRALGCGILLQVRSFMRWVYRYRFEALWLRVGSDKLVFGSWGSWCLGSVESSTVWGFIGLRVWGLLASLGPTQV